MAILRNLMGQSPDPTTPMAHSHHTKATPESAVFSITTDVGVARTGRRSLLRAMLRFTANRGSGVGPKGCTA